MKVAVIGAGLAGSDCAWILAQNTEIEVTLFEMKRDNPTPAQDAPHLFAELVCSNSLKSTSLLNPAGLLKNEIEALGSLVVQSAKNNQVPAGETLAVDREGFSGEITKALRTHPRIKVRDELVSSVEQIDAFDNFAAIVIATGPLTHDSLATDLMKKTGSEQLYFYDAIAPIVDGSTIDRSVAFVANRETRTTQRDRVQKVGEGDEEGHYLNLPLDKEQYFAFVEALKNAPKVPFHNFEEPKFFNGCQPIEVIAESGPLTLAHGPMKGRGLTDPKTGRWPYACVQLRKEKLGDASYNIVGFQTRLTWTAQKEIFKTFLPGLKNAEFFRFGSMHRNTYFISPSLLNKDLSLKFDNRLFLAGQIMGVEGYLESAAMGCFIGHVVASRLLKRDLNLPPPNTSLGCLVRHVLECEPKYYTPMNIHWGLFDELAQEDVAAYFASLSAKQPKKLDKSTRRQLLSQRSEKLFMSWFQKSYFSRTTSLREFSRIP